MTSSHSQAGAHRPIERVLRPLGHFAAHKLSGAGLLILAALAAVLWANSPAQDLYQHLLHTKLGVSVDGWSLSKDVGHWINDGLMGIFFFLVGLEIKRELLTGELSSPRKAALPAVAALGGMLIPALLYAWVNGSGPGASGWGIPMATDIAFALGLLALLGDRVPGSLKVFLTALAIVDDIGAVLVIAVFYTADVNSTSLLFGLGVFGLSIIANRLHVRSPVLYFILGTLVWLAFLKSGVHATVAALLMAFTIPARTVIEGPAFVATLRQRLDALAGASLGTKVDPAAQADLVEDIEVLVEKAQAPLRHLEHYLVGPVTFLVLPIFALANAGVSLGGMPAGALFDRVTVGVVVGLVVGKPLGVLSFSFIAVKLRLADLPEQVSWAHVMGVGCLAGVGFTMALFIGQLAFGQGPAVELAKLGIMAASVLAGVLGLSALWLVSRRAAGPGQPATAQDASSQ